MAAAHGFEVGDRVTVSTPKVSVIIATYCSGEGLQRVIDSLDAQTLPQDEFETIFVDDGSPDDTYAALQKLASTRANMKVLRIENSGWPSRPRNVGMQHATGDYLFFMDHDDSLYPDGLRRAHEFAVETDADIVSTKESKTNDSWWGMSSLTQGNTSHVKRHGGIWLLLPLVPHKLYRRSLIEERHILFPDGRAVLWEDQFLMSPHTVLPRKWPSWPIPHVPVARKRYQHITYLQSVDRELLANAGEALAVHC